MQEAGYITTSAVNDSPRYYRSFADLHVAKEGQDTVFGKAGDLLRQHFWQISSHVRHAHMLRW